MSLRLEMLQVARLAPRLLGESAELVRAFLLRQQNLDGGFKDRAGKSDLYYTVFGLDGLHAVSLQDSTFHTEVLGRAESFLRQFGSGEGLDFVHLCCLARCRAAVSQHPGRNATADHSTCDKETLRRIESFRTPYGGYNPKAGIESGTAYGCFLALGAYQDLKSEMPEPRRLANCLNALQTADGAWTNERHRGFATDNPEAQAGSTNATAAAVTVLRQLGLQANSAAGDWLLARCHPQGGFVAAPRAPAPDLLSTATALHALAGLDVSFEPIRERCLDFSDSLWTNEGGFHGHWGDDHLDCEYTFYALLALGHLSV